MTVHIVEIDLCLLCAHDSSISTVSYIDDPGHHDDNPRPAVQMENTYQLGKMTPILHDTVTDFNIMEIS